MGKLLILGAGGHGKVVADCALLSGAYTEIAFLDDEKAIGWPILNSCSVIGSFIDAGNFVQEFSEAFVALGNNKIRVSLIKYLNKLGFKIPSLIHPVTFVSKFAQIESGTVVLAGGIVNADAHIGMGGIINTGASVDHDCVLGRGVHLSPGARLGGAVSVGDYTWICMGASIANNVNVGEKTVIAAGAVVIEDVGNKVLVAGVPARKQEKLQLDYFP